MSATDGSSYTDITYDPYFNALGEFIHEFTLLEVELNFQAQKLAKVPPKIANAAMPLSRIDAVKDAINRLLEARGMVQRKKALERSFSQLGVIATVRNNLLHWGIQRPPISIPRKPFFVSNREMAATRQRIREYPVSVEDLQRMTFDLATIGFLVAFCLTSVRISAEIMSAAHHFQQKPWQYKSPQQSLPKKARRARLPKQKRPQDASEQ